MGEAFLIGHFSRLLALIGSASLRRALEWEVPNGSGAITLDDLGLRICEWRDGFSWEDTYWEPLERLACDAEELLDEIATSEALEQQQMKKSSKVTKKVSHIFLKLNPKLSASRMPKKVKAVRKSLSRLVKWLEMRARLLDCKPWTLGQTQSIRWSIHSCRVSSLHVVGRDDDKEAVVRFLLDKSDADQSGVPVIAIVGVDGIGKTTLAQLVYNDEHVAMNFKRRWWASISGVSNEKEIIARILGCTGNGINEKIRGLSISDLYPAMKESINNHGKYLLVFDDLRDCNGSLLCKIMPFLRSGTVGSRIVITTTSMSAAKSMGADQIHLLNGLTEEESGELFKLTTMREPDVALEKIPLAEDIVAKCDGVPLAIKAFASLVSTASNIKDLANRRIVVFDDIRCALRLNYNQLAPRLKPCLAYCSLFPKDYVFRTEELIYLWIGQGLVMLGSNIRSAEDCGYEYFTELLIRLFFQDVTFSDSGKVVSCKMHGVIHDWVQSLVKDESHILTKQNSAIYEKTRHLSVGYEMDSSWIVPPSLSSVDPPPPLRSFLALYGGSLSPLVLDELLTKLKLLLALNLRHQEIKVVPDSIGMLKYLRYLNLSHNKFSCLPDTIVMLVNLLTLDISWCEQLELLPVEFRKLYNLRHLDTENCCRLRHMPPSFEELSHLQHLSFFKVGKPMNDGRYSRLDVLSGLQLRGKLEIKFDEDAVWDENDRLELPIGITLLTITNYQGMRLLPSMLSNLVSLHIGPSSKIKQISLLRSLSSLKTLKLSYLEQLEYIETVEATGSAPFFLSLKVITLEGLPKLMGWSREVEAALTSQESVIRHISCPDFPQLSVLTVRCCRQLKFMPLCPKLQTLELNDVNHMLITNLLLSTSFHMSSSLETISIWDCDLQTFPGGNLTSLRQLDLRYCYKLEDLQLPPPEVNSLKQLVIQSCPELELWEEKNKQRGVDWDSLPKLCGLTLTGMPIPDQLPDWVQQLQALGKLYSIEQNNKRNIFEVHLKYSAETEKGDNTSGALSKYSSEIEAEPEQRDKPLKCSVEIEAEPERRDLKLVPLKLKKTEKKFDLTKQIRRPFKHFKKRPSTSQADPEQYQTHQP